MRPRVASRLAWSIGGTAVALMVAALVLVFVDRHVALPANASGDRWTFANVLSEAVNVAVPVLGILLASRVPENRIGWLFLVAGSSLALSALGYSYGAHALLASPGSLPAAGLAAWVGNWISYVALAMLAFLFLLFPTGHLRSVRWRPVAWFVAGALAVATVAALVASTRQWSHPFAQAAPSGLVGVLATVPLAAGLVCSVSAIVVRFRGSVGEERLQLKWFATGAVVLIAAFLASFFSTSAASPAAALSVLLSVAFLVLWGSIALAILKYRLYDIDLVINKTLVYGSLAAFITAVYVAIVVGIGAAIGHGSPTASLPLSILATAVVAVAFQPVRERVQHLANRLVYGVRATPYEVLSEFASRMGGAVAAEELLPRMARTLAEGTGARTTRVWLRVGNELRPEASWPPEAGAAATLPWAGGPLPELPEASLALAVEHRGDLLGALTLAKAAGERLTPAEEKLARDLAAQAGLVLRNVGLTEELLERLGELQASRVRIVAAQDAERRRLERNIHDGAQQQLVALAVKLNLAEMLVGRDPEKRRGILAQLEADAADALENLRDLARGIYPPLLAERGLVVALEAQAERAALPVTVEAEGVARHPQELEACVYFCALEALQNIAKYAGATRAEVRLAQFDGHLAFEVHDDGCGFDPSAIPPGSGTQNMIDRLAALGGTVKIRSAPGAGTTVRGEVPLAPIGADPVDTTGLGPVW